MNMINPSVTVFGAGAIGGFLAARLSFAGHRVSVVARGAQLAAIRQDGLRLIDTHGQRIAHVRAVGDGAELGLQDVVIIALKANAIGPALPAILPLLGPETIVVTAANGVPWWYFAGREQAPAGATLRSVDPDRAIWRTLGPERAIGCVLFPASEVVGPGVVRHRQGERLILGEPSGATTARLEDLVALFRHAGLDPVATPAIRDALWAKLVGNAVINPISALIGATMGELAADVDARNLLTVAMTEVDSVGNALGHAPAASNSERLAMIQSIGDHKTSMLQDLEAGRPLELDPLLGAVCELGAWRGVQTPLLDALLGLLRARVRLLTSGE